MARTSVSATHDLLAGASLGAGPVFVNDPNFNITSPGPIVLPQGVGIPLNIQVGNNTGQGVGSVQVELLNTGALVVTPSNIEIIGTMGIATAGFTNFTIQGNAPGGSETVTARLTGDLLGTLLEDEVTFTVNW